MVAQGEQVAASLARSAPEDVKHIVTTLEDAGFETWVVGGAVRDAVHGVPVDWDFATRARPKTVRKLFRRTIPVGVEHGTVGVLGRTGHMYEVTTFRRDVKPLGRRAVVEFADRIEDDLSRRDFTINALAWRPGQPDVLDPFGGLTDLEEGVLRTVGDPRERFREDYLRILRALRFAGQFDLRVEPETWAALVEGVANLERLSGERVREELLKVLGSEIPSRALSLYGTSGVLAQVVPELVRDSDGSGGLDLSHALLVVDKLRPHRTIPRLAALMAAGGSSAAELDALVGRLKKLRFSNDEMAAVRTLNGFPALPQGDAPEADRRRWLSRGGTVRLNDRIRIEMAWARVRREGQGTFSEQPLLEAIHRLRAELKRRTPLTVGDLAIGGHDLKELGLEPGPRFRDLLAFLLEEVLEEPDRNTAEYLRARVRAILVEGGRED